MIEFLPGPGSRSRTGTGAARLSQRAGHRRERDGGVLPARTREGRACSRCAPTKRSVPGEPASVPETARQPAFLTGCPPKWARDLIALEMEDHYVRAHTMLGSDLVLLRMRDAIAELEGVEGAQVHRSWWVARDAVERVEREGRNVRLLLSARAGLRRWRAAAPRNWAPRRAGSNPLAVPRNARLIASDVHLFQDRPADAARGRLPRQRNRDPVRRDELGLRTQPRFRHIQCWRLWRDRLRGDDARPARSPRSPRRRR